MSWLPCSDTRLDPEDELGGCSALFQKLSDADIDIMRVCHATHYSSSFLCFVSQLLIKQLESGLQLIHTSVVHRPIVKISTEPIQTLQ